MKRALAMLLTFAMVGSLMFMGFAGTAAAQDIGVDIGGDGGDGGDAANAAEVNQQNNNAQVGISEATATSGAADDANEKKSYDNGNDAGGGASAASAVDQTQDVTQTNEATVDQEATGGDGGDGGAIDIGVELGLLGIL